MSLQQRRCTTVFPPHYLRLWFWQTIITSLAVYVHQAQVTGLISDQIVKAQTPQGLCAGGIDSFAREESKRLRRQSAATERRRIQCEVANEVWRLPARMKDCSSLCTS